ncbi:MAG: WhiB family transcriptional regulator, partial [Actinomycetota bacterium]
GTAAAVRFCAACPGRAECLEYAIATPQPEWVWVGLDPVERRRLLRRRQKAARKERAADAA